MADEFPIDARVVEELWQKVAANGSPDYLNRYNGFPFESLEAVLGMGFLDHTEFPRVIEILEFRRLVQKYSIRPRHLLMYNGGSTGDPELRFVQAEKITRLDYNPMTNEGDLHSVKLAAIYDFVLFSQTIEHLYDPRTALGNLYSCLRQGGYIWTSMPTVNRQHSLPWNFVSGYTPIGLATLFAQTGFDVIEVGQWGNPKYINHVFRFDRWPTYYDLRVGLHRSLRFKLRPRYWIGSAIGDLFQAGTNNVFRTPAQCWILARKAADGLQAP